MRVYKGMGLEALVAEVDRIEPYLLEDSWPATTSMMIPSILRSASELADAIAACEDPDTTRVSALGERLQRIRAERERIFAEKRAREGAKRTASKRNRSDPTPGDLE
jgi:hypothetical protein